MRHGSNIVHLNVIGFQSAVAIAKDPSLSEKPFVISASPGGRAIVMDVSPKALEAEITPGMSLISAERRIRNLINLPPDLAACGQANREMERIAVKYAPAVQNDSGGHLFLDLSGTSRLFGPAVDCSVKIVNEIRESLNIEPSLGVANNKLVAKIATRIIRPYGIAHVREGEEASILSSQDISLLPGIGPGIRKILSVTALDTIGSLAALSDEEARILLGQKGCLLRDAARGIDNSPVEPNQIKHRSILRRLDFSEDIIDMEIIRGSLGALAEDTGLDLRRSKLAAGKMCISVLYSDGVQDRISDTLKSHLYLDADLFYAALKAYERAVKRRIRIRSISLELASLEPLFTEPDLFIPEKGLPEKRIQDAADSIRTRFGINALIHGPVLLASRVKTGDSPLISLHA